MAIVLGSAPEAVDFLENYLAQPYDLDEPIQFIGELETLEIVIEGTGLHGELTGELARALAIYQDAIYAFAKTAVFGDDNHPYVRLSPEQKRLFELEIKVEDGCIKINIDFKPVMEGLQEAMRKMDTKTIVALVITVALIAAGGVTAYHLGGTALENADKVSQRSHHESLLKMTLDSNTDVVKRSIDLLEKSLHQGASARDATYSHAVTRSMARAQTTGITEVAKAVPYADSIEYGRIVLDKDDIAALNRRAPRATSERFEVEGEFEVIAETTAGVGSVTKVTFLGKSLPGEITVDFIEKEFDEDKADAMWAAIRNRTPVRVKLEATMIRDTVKGGVLIDIQT